MKKHYTKQEIKELLARFMAGESSLQEEEALAQYFRTHEVDNAWREYKEMFALFDEGKVSPDSLTPRPLPGERGLKRSVFPLRWLTKGIAAGIVLMIGFSWLKKDAEPAVEEPVVAQVPAVVQEPEKEPAVAEKPQETREAMKPQKLADSAKPKKAKLPATPSIPSPEEELPVIPPEKQALVDIYLAEEALQVAYELQAQEEELRAYAASLTGQELPETVIAF